MKKLSVLFTLLFFSISAHADYLTERKFQLSASTYLKITEHEDLSCIVEISSNERKYSFATIENSAISQATKVRLCASCAESYFIALYDRSSAYGATTGIVAWQDGWENWHLQVLPFNVAGIEDEDHNGVFELVDLHSEKTENKFEPVKMKYAFRNGLVCPE